MSLLLWTGAFSPVVKDCPCLFLECRNMKNHMAIWAMVICLTLRSFCQERVFVGKFTNFCRVLPRLVCIKSPFQYAFSSKIVKNSVLFLVSCPERLLFFVWKVLSLRTKKGRDTSGPCLYRYTSRKCKLHALWRAFLRGEGGSALSPVSPANAEIRLGMSLGGSAYLLMTTLRVVTV